jgi:hypothetical protein
METIKKESPFRGLTRHRITTPGTPIFALGCLWCDSAFIEGAFLDVYDAEH